MSSKAQQTHAGQGRYAHVVLSPHLDDAALSCGGLIRRAVAAGEPVLVVNLCGGSPPLGSVFSDFATFQHTRWGVPADQAMALRRAEDAAALSILGADSLQLDLLDAIYRMPAAYMDDETLFGPVALGDPLAEQVRPSIEAIIGCFPTAVLYAPLGVGNHVDHQATFAIATALAEGGAKVLFYEDFPYVAREGALEARFGELGAVRFAPVLRQLDTEVSEKIAAVAAYASQISTLFGDSERMARAIAEYAAHVAESSGAYAERLWRRAP